MRPDVFYAIIMWCTAQPGHHNDMEHKPACYSVQPRTIFDTRKECEDFVDTRIKIIVDHVKRDGLVLWNAGTLFECISAKEREMLNRKQLEEDRIRRNGPERGA